MTACRGCGLVLPTLDGPVHPYIGATPSCWRLYGRALERAYSDAAHRDALQLVVDAYACQHPGEPSRRAAQSVGIHLVTLCMVIEHGADPRRGTALHRRLVAQWSFPWLLPPAERGALTVADLLDTSGAPEYQLTARAWAESVWEAWEVHHDVVREWIAVLVRLRP
jgi:hypothetical protein